MDDPAVDHVGPSWIQGEKPLRYMDKDLVMRGFQSGFMQGKTLWVAVSANPKAGNSAHCCSSKLLFIEHFVSQQLIPDACELVLFSLQSKRPQVTESVLC